MPDLIKAVDETGLYLLPHVGRTWAPREHMPVVDDKEGKEHLSLIAAMVPNGQLYVSRQGLRKQEGNRISEIPVP